MSKHEEQSQQLAALRGAVAVGQAWSIPGVVVPPLASDEVQASAERFRELRKEAKSAVNAAAVAHTEQGEARESRVKARAAAALEGRSPKAAELKAPAADVDELIEYAEGLVEATKAQREVVVRTMTDDFPAWRQRNAQQIHEAKAALEEHIDAAREAFDRLSASAHLRVYLEGRVPVNNPRADAATAYRRGSTKVDFFAPSGSSDADKMFDALRSHYTFDGMPHEPVETVPGE